MLESDNACIASRSFECLDNQVDEEIEDDLEPSLELLRLVEQEAKEINPHEETTEVVNLGIEKRKERSKLAKL